MVVGNACIDAPTIGRPRVSGDIFTAIRLMSMGMFVGDGKSLPKSVKNNA